MKKMRSIVVFLCLFSAASVSATEPATPEEIYENVLKGVQVLQALGAEGLPAFNDPKGEFVWKDTYVQVYECDANKIVGQINPALRQWTPEKFKSIVDKKGNRITKMICDASKKPDGDWVEYWWPKAGETEASRKITFVLQVPGQPYQVSAGIYDDSVSLEQLRVISK
ncbi:MAG: hypothetical protein CR981_01780 [Proteobacteria bacterium]|nr:MAG: hypothetical protein CR981_01780 [Pseudomonadota bacterium]